MYLMKDIVKEGTASLREKCQECSIPLIEEDLKVLAGLHEYVVASQIDELAKKYGLRPGVGIAGPQVGYNKRMFAIELDDFLDNNKHYSIAVVNPKIVARSKEITYLPGGEGCLSVDRETSGITPRNYMITVKGYFYDFISKKLKFQTLQLKGYAAIAFQHEYDHLDGILFVDKLYDTIDGAFPLFEVDEDED